METSQNDQQDAVNAVYGYAANLLVNEKKSKSEVEQTLIEEGIDAESAKVVVKTLSEQLKEAKSEHANADMLYGALWCVGGIIATTADFGFIFWGAIVYGAIQFVKGAINA